MTALVLPFAEIGAADVAAVGGKAASLGELVSAGLPVPPGYVVTTAAFEAALRALDADGHIRAEVEALRAADHDVIRQASTRLRSRLEQAPLPAPVDRAIAAAYAQLTGGQPAPVAVRSSATSEDGPEASFAGMAQTLLWVRGAEAVGQAVRRCWASLYSPESVSYRARRRLPEDEVAMAVVVQRMVDARSAGVAFTRSPVTGDRSVVAVDSSWGLGSAVVGGEVTPDAFVLSKVTQEVTSRTVAVKDRWHRPDRDGGGVLDEPIPDERRQQPSMNDDELRALLALAVQVERHYGRPMDIEWAVDAMDGTIALLQARPETVWSARAATATAAPKAHAFDHVVAMLGTKARIGSERRA